VPHSITGFPLSLSLTLYPPNIYITFLTSIVCSKQHSTTATAIAFAVAADC
jgi:hypothetical protein